MSSLKKMSKSFGVVESWVHLSLSKTYRFTRWGRCFVSKNHNGSFTQLHVKNKVVPVFACPEAGDRCPARILDLYFYTSSGSGYSGSILCPPTSKSFPLVYQLPGTVPLRSEETHSIMTKGKVKNMCMQAGVAGHKCAKGKVKNVYASRSCRP